MEGIPEDQQRLTYAGCYFTSVTSHRISKFIQDVVGFVAFQTWTFWYYLT